MEISKKTIMDAWVFLREKNHSIPDATLDFMRDSALKALESVPVEKLGYSERASDPRNLASGDGADIENYKRQIHKLTLLLRTRDGGDHDSDCKQHYRNICTCGHSAVLEYFREAPASL